MPISWNEIRQNAIQFSRDWSGAKSESAEKQTFWNEFFRVFGMNRRTFAIYEEPVRKISGQYGFIDLFWPGMLLVEHKSFGKDLGKAESQAFQYIRDLHREGREAEIPRYVIISDFARFALHDLEPQEQKKLPLFDQYRVETIEFPLDELHENIHQFAFIAGYQQHKYEDQDPINIQAVGYMDALHDALEDGGYSGHELERFLVRILFCLFAEDTGIFERDAFSLFLKNRTKPDGSDLGPQLSHLFEVLNTPPEQRQKNLDETLAAFPYVNGALFAEHLRFADFNRDMYLALEQCTLFDWSCISPAIFGSLFQGVMQPRERRQIGAHYTSERDILKVVRSLFLDDLRAEFEKIKTNMHQIKQFHQKIASLAFLDPACGCGNFLVIAYRELRLLELDILAALHRGQRQLDVKNLSQVDVDAFYGIEIGEWPARIAEVAMWLMDHQMNVKLSETFGQYFVRLPLKKSPTIVLGNALRLDWKRILPPEKCSYVLGNPPFVGKQFMTPEQNLDMKYVCGHIKNHGLLDYVTAWYVNAVSYIKGVRTRVAFVSTNSISQGEQVGVLWQFLFDRGIKIHFAHRTFSWESEARGKAHVHVVIIGFGVGDYSSKKLYDYKAIDISFSDASEDGKPTEQLAAIEEVSNISPYLVAGPPIAVMSRSKPLCSVPEIVFGSMANDGGNFLMTSFGRDQILKEEPDAKKYIRRFVGAEEFLNGIERWCLWLNGENPGEFLRLRAVKDIVQAVAEYRKKSRRETTKGLANTPSYFGEIRQPDCTYLLIPRVSSERRRYIPIGFMRPEIIASDAVLLVPQAELYHFGILSSAMHMAWVRQICGRLKSDYRYSAKLVYNNFPWPLDISDTQKNRVNEAAQRILSLRVELGDGRCGFLSARKKESSATTLADLYSPEGMPQSLFKAHAALDRAVDRCYRAQPFTSERQRVEFLFALYEKLTAPLIAAAGKKKRRG
ncbi:MAG: class I SAM-dependent DNA methyltransferase [Pirellulales bacterium]|nr:class I SAM-dependent DNA methyltransferase [Pirellulales bacterium]